MRRPIPFDILGRRFDLTFVRGRQLLNRTEVDMILDSTVTPPAISVCDCICVERFLDLMNQADDILRYGEQAQTFCTGGRVAGAFEAGWYSQRHQRRNCRGFRTGQGRVLGDLHARRPVGYVVIDISPPPAAMGVARLALGGKRPL